MHWALNIVQSVPSILNLVLFGVRAAIDNKEARADGDDDTIEEELANVRRLS